MSMWETTLNLTNQNGNLQSKPIKINSDIFQGDSLSPLLICLSFNTLVKRTKRNRIWLLHPEKKYKSSILYG